MGHRLGLATRTQFCVCKSPFPSARIAVSLFRTKTVQQRRLLPREVETRLPEIVGSHTRWELITLADFQLCLHRLLMSTGCKSSHNGFLDVSCSNVIYPFLHYRYVMFISIIILKKCVVSGPLCGGTDLHGNIVKLIQYTSLSNRQNRNVTRFLKKMRFEFCHKLYYLLVSLVSCADFMSIEMVC